MNFSQNLLLSQRKLNTWNNGFESRYSTIHADVSEMDVEKVWKERKNEVLQETEELNKAFESKKENENQNFEKEENDL